MAENSLNILVEIKLLVYECIRGKTRAFPAQDFVLCGVNLKISAILKPHYNLILQFNT